MIDVVIPCYRGKSELIRLTEDLLKIRLVNKVILVFDGGLLETWITINNLVNTNSKVIGVKHSRNYGQHNALITGFSFVESKFALTIDEDYQHDPNDIELLYKKIIESQSDVVYGVYEFKNHNWFRNITSNILNQLLKVGLKELHSDYSAFRLINK